MRWGDQLFLLQNRHFRRDETSRKKDSVNRKYLTQTRPQMIQKQMQNRLIYGVIFAIDFSREHQLVIAKITLPLTKKLFCLFSRNRRAGLIDLQI